MSKRAVYPGTFDPITNGHLDIIKRALNLFKSVIVLVVEHSEKSPMFSVKERVRFVREVTKIYKGVEVDSFDGLLVDYIKNKGAKVIIRGLRAISDFDYEFQLTQLNRKLCPEIETIFIMPGEEHFFLSSSMVKEIASHGGDVTQFVPKIVADALKKNTRINTDRSKTRIDTDKRSNV
ncbi:MAG: pantetheine-phosphate adenylyltransferase [bacterium]|nr:pantetheine-phosphate adenylyltransferase [bacterium]